MNVRAQAHTSIDQPKGGAWAWAWVPAAVLAACIAVIGTIAAVRVIGDLESMQADVHRMSDRLAVLDAVNQKLGKLDMLSSQLGSMRGELNLTLVQLQRANGLLATADGQLATADGEIGTAHGDLVAANASMESLIATTRGMNQQLRSVGAMSADVHEMAHKFDNSFLFRGIK